MQIVYLGTDRARRLDALPNALQGDGFCWLDLPHEAIESDRERWRDAIAALTGVRIFDVHLRDAANPQQPSFFNSTHAYDLLVFRRLAQGEAVPLAEIKEPRAPRGRGRRLQEIVTRPVTFFVFERLLVTVSDADSRTIEQVRQRLLDAHPGGARLPQRPEELMLRLLNGMVDRYLELRQPLTERLDRWQRELLDPRRPFPIGRRCCRRASRSASWRTCARNRTTRYRSCATAIWSPHLRRNRATPTWCASPTSSNTCGASCGTRSGWRTRWRRRCSCISRPLRIGPTK